MKIKVIDAFGAHVGDATVTWIAHGETQRQRRAYLTQMELEIISIFDEKLTLAMPTHNQAMSWRLEIETGGG